MSTKPSIPFIPSFNNLENASAVFAALDNLCSERAGWEQNEHKSSTIRLYSLLAAVYQVYENSFVNAKDDDRRTLRQQLVSKLNAIGINVRKGADTLGLLVRYVFQADRRRVMSYKYAILAAKSHDIYPTMLKDWLTDQGGLEEVVRRVSFNQETVERRAAVQDAINRVEQAISQRVNVPLATVNVPVSAASARVVMLAELCGEGEFKILYVFDSPAEGVQKALIRKAATGYAAADVENKVNHAEVTRYINFDGLTRSDARLAA